MGFLVGIAIWGAIWLVIKLIANQGSTSPSHGTQSRSSEQQETLEALADALMCEPADLIMRDPTSPDPIWSVWDRVPSTKRNDALRVLAAFAEDSAKTGT